jgi:pyruvate/2-oxoglutarate dehydrogenase complex dihydrolipoamide dehydrogenase (E3) component
LHFTSEQTRRYLLLEGNVSEIDQYEILVLGSGEAGKYLAWTMAKAGRRTAVVERRLIGGSCPNIACLPSKNIIHSAKVASLFRRASEFGMTTGSLAIDMAGVRQRKRKMVDDLITIHLDRYKASGVELILGEGRFLSPKILEVRLNDGGTRLLTGERVFLNLGTHAAIPNVPGLAAAKPLTHVEALELDRVPEHLIVLGGGYVGLEMGHAMRRFGSRVSIVEKGSQLALREDSDVAESILQLFKDDGIQVLLAADTLSLDGISGEGVRLEVRTGQGNQNVEGSDILVAAGRTPNTQGIGLEAAGVQVDERGYIKVNERLETTAPDVWAMGECAGSPHFTHVAFDDFRVVRDNLNGGNRTTRDRLVPYCIFTDPQLARVGLSESDAEKGGVECRLAKVPMAAVLRTRTLSETRGFMKAIIDAHSDRILGFTAFGNEAGDLMAVVQIAIIAGMPYTSLRDAILTHPTMAEGLTVLFDNVPAKSQTPLAGVHR